MNFPHRPVTKWLKHGVVCVFLQRKDLTVFMDIEPNPGPLHLQSSSFQPSRVLSESSVSQVFDNYSRLLLISNNKPACFIYTRDDLINIRRLRFCKPSNSDLFNMKSLGILRYRVVRSGKAVKTKRQLERLMIPTIVTANRPRIINSRSVDVSNVIYPSKVESAQSFLPRLSFAVWNALSIHRKAVVICDIITSNRLDIFAITESWLNSENNVAIAEILNTLSDFTFFQIPRPGNKGGGVAIFVLKVFNIKENLTLNLNHLNTSILRGLIKSSIFVWLLSTGRRLLQRTNLPLLKFSLSLLNLRRN